MPNDDKQTTVGFFKISPGENAKNWGRYRDGRYIIIGWSKGGDLRRIHSVLELRERLKETHPDKYPTPGRAWNAANQLWMFRNLERGDKVLANKGKANVLAVGTVTKGYEWRPRDGGRTNRHFLEVEWNPIFDSPRPIETQEKWNQNTIAPAKPELYKLLMGKRLPIRSAESETDTLYHDEVASSYMEGAAKEVQLTRYERDPKARRECLNHYGSQCVVCGIDFGERYGKSLAGYIHVHHLRQIATIRREYKVDPIADLRPVCPNCHAVIHYRKNPYDIEEVRAMIHLSTK